MPGRRRSGALWKCPHCDRPFANRRQPHSCSGATVADFLSGRTSEALGLFNRFAALVRTCGPVTLAPARTRVGFQVRMIFASVNRLGARHLDAHVVLARRLEHPRFRKVESVSARNHVHHFRISDPGDLDDEVLAWLREAYDVGCQRHLV